MNKRYVGVGLIAIAGAFAWSVGSKVVPALVKKVVPGTPEKAAETKSDDKKDS